LIITIYCGPTSIWGDFTENCERYQYLHASRRYNYDTYKGIVDRAKSLSTGGIIVVRVSELALKVRGIDADEVHDFIGIVPFGDAGIARLQTVEGHAYLQVHNLAP